MAEQRGSVLHDRRDGWYVQFRSVRWPGDAKGRRVRIHRVPGFGKIENEAQGYKVLYRIWAEVADGKPLHQVLSWYVSEHAPQNLWLRRWRLFCDYKEADVRSGHLSARRVYELRRYEDRGYLHWFRDLSILQVDKAMLVSWIRWMRKHHAVGEKTIKNVLGDIAQFLGWLRDQGDLLEVPTIPFPELKLIEYNPQIPDAATVLRVLARISVRKRGLFLARSYMGFRPSEARRLNVGDLRRGARPDLLDAYIDLPPRSSKKRRGRRLQLHPEVAGWLASYGELGRFGAEPLFANSRASNREQRWTESSERRTLVRALRTAGVTSIKPNELGRHFFATEAVNNGADIYATQEWLGHTDPKTTERYAKLRPVPIARVLGAGPSGRGPAGSPIRG